MTPLIVLWSLVLWTTCSCWIPWRWVQDDQLWSNLSAAFEIGRAFSNIFRPNFQPSDSTPPDVAVGACRSNETLLFSRIWRQVRWVSSCAQPSMHLVDCARIVDWLLPTPFVAIIILAWCPYSGCLKCRTCLRVATTTCAGYLPWIAEKRWVWVRSAFESQIYPGNVEDDPTASSDDDQ